MCKTVTIILNSHAPLRQSNYLFWLKFTLYSLPYYHTPKQRKIPYIPSVIEPQHTCTVKHARKLSESHK